MVIPLLQISTVRKVQVDEKKVADIFNSFNCTYRYRHSGMESRWFIWILGTMVSATI
jgi:hypothetical protein